MQFCVAGGVPVTMQRLCGVHGDGAVEGFFALFLQLFSASSSSELRPLPIHDCGAVDIHTLIASSEQQQQEQQQQQHKVQTGCDAAPRRQTTARSGEGRNEALSQLPSRSSSSCSIKSSAGAA